MWQIYVGVKMNELDRESIIKILKYPHKNIVLFLLQIVNLTEKEYDIIDNIYLKGYTEEETANKLLVSRTTIQKHKRKAFLKLQKVWTNNELINKILSEY